jgi:hypothetical protein
MAATTAIPAQTASRRNLTRLTASDVVVILAIVLSLIAGGLIKYWHDTRTHETDVAGITLSYPSDWIRLPVFGNEQLKAISSDDGQSQIIFSVTPTTLEDVNLAVANIGVNQSSGESDYTQLANVSETVDGTAAVQTDYAYVKTKIGTATAPKVVRGRQVAWIKDGQLFVLAMEGVDDDWDQTEKNFDRVVDKVEI